jgi:predicted nuclease of restriction endonuclease-like RecB superfamily
VLTADLVLARRRHDELRLVPLDARGRMRALELATAYLAIAEAHVGRTREEYEEALGVIEVSPREKRLADGLAKLVEDRCQFDAAAPTDPQELRRVVFDRASAARQALGPEEHFDREALLAAVAEEHGLTPDALERALYADLRGAHVLTHLGRITPEHLVAEYELAQAQAVLLRAVRVHARVECTSPGAYRILFRKLKFLRLLYTIQPAPGGAYQIDIDGPFSLFESVTKYGLQLALALPLLQSCERWRIEADVRWGTERIPLKFHLAGESPAAGPGGGRARVARLSDEVAVLLKGLEALKSPWRVKPATVLLDLPGVGLCVPDLVFEHPEQDTRVYLEVLGYWSRDAVWRRVELVEQGLGERILFAVGKHLRVSEAALGEELPGALYVYARTLMPREVLARVEALAERPVNAQPAR